MQKAPRVVFPSHTFLFFPNLKLLPTGTAQAAVASAPSASAEALKSLWKMLSMKPSKPTADSTQPDLEAVQRQVSAQQALSREISEPAVIEAATDDSLKRPKPDDGVMEAPCQYPSHTSGASQQYPSSTPVEPEQDPSSNPQPAAGVIAVTEDNTAAGVVTGIVKQQSSMAKRFGFLSSLRRGSTAAEGSSTILTHTAEPPQDPSEASLEQAEGATTTQLAGSDLGVGPEPAMGSASTSLGVQQGSVLGVQQGATLGASRGLQADSEHATAAPIELPPVFEYGSEGEEAQDEQVIPTSSAVIHSLA